MPDIVVSEKDGFRWDAFVYQTQHKPWDNPKMRQVLNYSLDREAIHESVYFGTGSIGYDAFLPGTPFYDPNYKPYTRDLDMAKRLLDEVGYNASVPLEAQVNLDEPHQKAFQIAQANLAEIGLKVNISVVDTTTLLKQSRDGQYDFSTTWWGYRPDPDGWITGKFRTGGSINFSFLSDPDLDKLIDQAQQSADLDERVKLYRQTAQKINEDGTHVFFHYGSSIRGLSPSVKGAVHFVDSILRFHTISLE
jgi:peptide/nickel transport system substrate-binding protein